MSEDIVTALGSVDNASRWSLDLLQSPLQLLNSLASRPIWFYMNCVQLYSARDLTKSGDILAAFNGVSNHIEDALSSPLTFGLPTSHFDIALLWTPLGSSKRRMGDESEDERFDDEPSRRRNSGHTRETNFPSWSWCGWQGCTMDYLTNSIVDDCLEDVNEWLTYHTWIQWHIRDGRGRLRPLWDSVSAREPRFSERRWYGYRAEQQCKEPSCSESDEFEASIQPALRTRVRKWQPTDIIREVREMKALGEVNRKQIRPGVPPGGPVGSPPPPAVSGQTSTYTSTTDTEHDQYGRLIGLHHRRGESMYFQRTIPESPYKVNMTKYTPEKDKEYPDSPILQFWTHSAFLRRYLSEQVSERDRKNGLIRFNIIDVSSDWCGTIKLSENWVEAEEARQENAGLNWDSAQYEFLALSEAKKFTEEECGAWTYYLPLERRQSEWDLYFVLLTEKRNGTWSRVALGKVFSAAFENGLGGSSEWKEIVLV